MKVLLIIFALFTFQVSAANEIACSALIYQNGISREKAIEIAKADAVQAYKDIEKFEIVVRETKKKWFIDFELKDKELNGGAPKYVISKKTGKILKAIYYQ